LQPAEVRVEVLHLLWSPVAYQQQALVPALVPALVLAQAVLNNNTEYSEYAVQFLHDRRATYNHTKTAAQRAV
jgi:hypothetical protein